MSFLVPQYEKGEFAIGELAGEVFCLPSKHKDKLLWDFEPEVESGWFCRLAGDGVATVWTGAFTSKQAAMDYVEDEYDIDPTTGEPLVDEDEEEAA